MAFYFQHASFSFLGLWDVRWFISWLPWVKWMWYQQALYSDLVSNSQAIALGFLKYMQVVWLKRLGFRVSPDWFGLYPLLTVCLWGKLVTSLDSSFLICNIGIISAEYIEFFFFFESILSCTDLSYADKCLIVWINELCLDLILFWKEIGFVPFDDRDSQISKNHSK